MRLSPKSAFTLVELLVVITIIGILVALLLPAVQAAREAARTMHCSNNLRQFGLAAMQHESSWKFFPTGGWGYWWVGDPDRGFDERQPGGWLYNLLPYIEQEAVYQLPRDGDPSNVTPTQLAGAKHMVGTPLLVAICPSRRASALYPKDPQPGKGHWNYDRPDLVARNDYAVNCGDQSTVEHDSPTTLQQGDSPGYSGWGVQSIWTGISFQRSKVTVADITDGTSNTIFVGEKYLNPADYETGSDGGDNENPYVGLNVDLYRSTYPGTSPETARTPMQDRSNYYAPFRFGSAHASTCGFVLCDGSTQRLSYSIDRIVFSYLGNRHDGQPIGGNSL